MRRYVLTEDDGITVGYKAGQVRTTDLRCSRQTGTPPESASPLQSAVITLAAWSCSGAFLLPSAESLLWLIYNYVSSHLLCPQQLHACKIPVRLIQDFATEPEQASTGIESTGSPLRAQMVPGRVQRIFNLFAAILANILGRPLYASPGFQAVSSPWSDPPGTSNPRLQASSLKCV